MINKPVEDGYFIIRDDGQPVLLGSYSPASGNTYYPIRKLCPETSSPVETIELPIEGVLYSWTYMRMKLIGSQQLTDDGGHGVGQIDLPCGTRIQSVISGVTGDWKIGMTMRLALYPVADEEGISWCSYCYEPVSGAEG